MLEYTEFKNAVEKGFLKYLPDEFRNLDVSCTTVNKVNVKREALCFKNTEKSMSVYPTLYFDDYYEDYLRHGDLSLTLRTMASGFVNAAEEGKHFIVDMENTQWLRSNVVMTLVNKEANLHLLETCPYREFLDLAIIYRVICSKDDDGFASAIVTNDLMGKMQLDENELYELAKENTPQLLPLCVMNISPEFLIMTNESKSIGAAAILYDGILEKVANQLGGDIFILPSSRHETIIIPAGDVDAEGMRAIVKNANESVVSREDILSYSVYKYCREEKNLKIA